MLIQLPPNTHRIEILHGTDPSAATTLRIVLQDAEPLVLVPVPASVDSVPSKPNRSAVFRFRPGLAVLPAVVAIAFLAGHGLRPTAATTPPPIATAAATVSMDRTVGLGAAETGQRRIVRAAPASPDGFGLN